MTFELYTVYISASKKGKKINNTVQCSAVCKAGWINPSMGGTFDEIVEQTEREG